MVLKRMEKIKIEESVSMILEAVESLCKYNAPTSENLLVLKDVSLLLLFCRKKFAKKAAKRIMAIVN